MPRVLIAGCGYLGQAVADLFLAANWQVEGWTQSAKSAAECFSGRYPVYGVDISDSKQVAAQEGEFSMVVHCASTHGGDADLYRRIYLDGARNLIDRFAGSALLFTSSTSVYAQNAGEWVTEKSLAQPKHETGKILRKAEEVVLAAGGVIARLAGLYGPGRSFLLKRFLSGAAITPEDNRFANQIHRDDAATAFFFLADRPSDTGAIYNVVDNEPILQSECYQWLAQELNRPIFSTRGSIARAASKRKRGENSKRVSNAKLRARGWIPRYPSFAEGMTKSVLPSFGL